IKTNACGFNQSTLVTKPVIVNGFFESYSASKEWCAMAEDAINTIAHAKDETTTSRRKLLLMMHSPNESGFSVLLAEELLDFAIRNPPDVPLAAPRARIRPQVFNGHFILQRIQVRPR